MKRYIFFKKVVLGSSRRTKCFFGRYSPLPDLYDEKKPIGYDPDDCGSGEKKEAKK
jgi:hypothetical protein